MTINLRKLGMVGLMTMTLAIPVLAGCNDSQANVDTTNVKSSTNKNNVTTTYSDDTKTAIATFSYENADSDDGAANVAKIKTTIIQDMTNNGYKLVTASDYNIDQSVSVHILYATLYFEKAD